MPAITEFLGPLTCLAVPLGVAVWIAWLSRRPGRSCPGCSAQISVKANHCPACGITIKNSLVPLDGERKPPSESRASTRRSTKSRQPTIT
jgi:predicted amidophosphoribosyltransferase